MSAEQVNEAAEAQAKEEKKKEADNPKGHSIGYLAKTAAETRWKKYSGRAKVAEACEISVALLADVDRSPEYREEVKNLLLTSGDAKECMKRIERDWADDQAWASRRMSLEPEVIKGLVEQVVPEIAPRAAEQAKAEAEAKAKEKAEKDAAKAAEKKAKDAEGDAKPKDKKGSK